MGEFLHTIINALKQLIQVIIQLFGRLVNWWVEKFRTSELRGKLVLVVVPLVSFCCFSIFLIPTPDNDSISSKDTTTVANVENAEKEEVEPTETSEPTAMPPTSTTVPTPTSTATQIPFIVVSHDIDARQGPGLDYEVAESINRGDELFVVAVDDSGNWYNVILKNGSPAWVNRGLVNSSGLTKSLDVAATIPALPTKQATRTPSATNVPQATSTVASLPTNTAVPAPVNTQPPPPTNTVAPQPTDPPAPTEAPPPSTGCVNVNVASFDELQQIIHIGPERAQEIIDRRPWPSVRSLDALKGIGPSRLNDILNQGVACV